MLSQHLTMKPAPRVEVTYCAIDRIGMQAYLVVCSTAAWHVYRLDKFSSAKESLTPVQVTVDEGKDGALLSNVRMLRLFRLPPAKDSSGDLPRATGPQLGGVFVSERCQEIDYSHTSPYGNGTDTQPLVDSSEDLTAFSFTDERILKRLPPTPSSVVDLQIQRSTAAVLCESHEIVLIDLLSMEVKRRISSLASLAMALGPRWIAYPGLAETSLDDESDSDDGEEIVPEALIRGGSHQLLSASQSRSASISCASPPSTYNAIDVAQNVASGFYYLGKTIAPYLSTSPGTQPTATPPHLSDSNASILYPVNQQNYPPNRQQTPTFPTNTSANTNIRHQTQQNGWVVVQDLRSGRRVTGFQCHSTALVHLSFDSSGTLLATSSTKGQNVHVYRLLPPLQATKTPSRQQLLYKLQRGITHASIADMAFSQDAKWLSVTSAHGTSHLYAIHPDGKPMGLHTHATDSDSSLPRSGAAGGERDRDVSDFCAGLRTIEPKTLSRVLKIHHTLQATTATAPPLTTEPLASSSYGTQLGMSASSAFYYNSPPATLMNTALDASQALFSQLAQSTGIDFSGGSIDDQDLASRRRRRRRRLSCLFAHDGLKMAIYCDGTLKLYDLSVHPPKSSRRSSLSLTASFSAETTKTRPSPFGFDATVAELKAWDLMDTPRVRSESAGVGDAMGTNDLATSTKPRSSEMRTFEQRGLPLWAHPKVSFRVVDVDHPEGLLLQVKRKGPSNLELGGDGLVHGGDDQQLFVMEMDAYFGLGGSPVFTGQSDQRIAPEVPRLDLAESMNLAISTTIKTPPSKHARTTGKSIAGITELANDEQHSAGATVKTMKKTKKKNGKHGKGSVVFMSGSESSGSSLSSSPEGGSSSSTSVSSSPSILQFTLQDMYFALPSAPTQ